MDTSEIRGQGGKPFAKKLWACFETANIVNKSDQKYQSGSGNKSENITAHRPNHASSSGSDSDKDYERQEVGKYNRDSAGSRDRFVVEFAISGMVYQAPEATDLPN